MCLRWLARKAAGGWRGERQLPGKQREAGAEKGSSHVSCGGCPKKTQLLHGSRGSLPPAAAFGGPRTDQNSGHLPPTPHSSIKQRTTNHADQTQHRYAIVAWRRGLAAACGRLRPPAVVYIFGRQEVVVWPDSSKLGCCIYEPQLGTTSSAGASPACPRTSSLCRFPETGLLHVIDEAPFS